MRSNYKKIGRCISLVDERNNDGSITNLTGLSIDKCYIPSVANVIGTDLKNYKIIRKGQFSCSLMQVSRDQRVPIAMYANAAPAIMSPAYDIFEVSCPDELLPEYMELWFHRSEFDREASFYAIGGVRGSLDWEDFCNMELPVPPIEEQRKVVHDYQVITDRIALLRKMNENLEAQAQMLFHSLFIDLEDVDCSLCDICDINPPRALKKGKPAMCFEMATLPTSGNMPMAGEFKSYNGGARFQNGDTLLARITPCFENGKAAYINHLQDGEIAFGSTEYIVFSSKGDIPPSFFYFLVRNKKFRDFKKSRILIVSVQNRKETAVLGEVFSSLVLLRLVPSESVF